MPRTPVYGPENEYHSPKDTGEDEYERMMKEKKQTRKLGTGEPILLYIGTSLGRYELVDRTFDSRIEARQYAEENYGRSPTKILSQSEAVAEAKRQEERTARRKELIEKAKTKVISGAKTVGRESVAALKRGVEKAGEYSERRQEHHEEMERKRSEAEERQLEKEYRSLEKERIALEKEKLRQSREVISERSAIRKQRTEQPQQQPQQTRGSFLNMPNVWAPAQRTTIGPPHEPKYSVNPPPPITSSKPWVPGEGTRIKPAPWSPNRPSIGINPPNIWQKQSPQPTPVRTPAKKHKPKKSKKRRK